MKKVIDIPPGWIMEEKKMDGASFYNAKKKLFVIASVSKELDGKRWQHVSVSHRGRVPNYDELSEVKKIFIGEENYGFLIWPPGNLHVNIHPNCLHLWSCLDEHPLPEFSRGLGTI